MIKDIKYSGYTARPSDYECQDGELSMSLNLLNEDGGNISPIQRPQIVFNGFTNGERVYIHESSSFGRHYVCIDKDNVLYWLDSKFQKQSNWEIATDVTVEDIKFIGNVAVITTPDKVKYFIWRYGKYISLEDKPPFPNIEFGLYDVTPPRESGYVIHIEGVSDSIFENMENKRDYHLSPSQDEINLVDKTLASHNIKYIADTTQEGHFLQPFFVRYAVRLFDGSYYWQSNPILMMPNMEFPMWLIMGASAGNKNVRLFPSHKECSLSFRMLPFNKDAWQNWKELILSIDIFISQPFYLFDQSKDIRYTHPNRLRINSYITNSSGQVMYNGIYASSLTTPNQTHWTAVDNNGSDSYNYLHFYKHPKTLGQQIASVNNFYLYASIPYDEFSSMINEETSNFREFEKRWLYDTDMSSLVARPTLSDDFSSHRTIIPSYQTIYNQRLNFANLKIFPARPLSLRSSVQAIEPSEDSEYKKTSIKVWINKNGAILTSEYNSTTIPADWSCPDSCVDITNADNFPMFVFYPDAEAVRMQIKCNDKYLTLPLKPHSHLNGAYWSRFEHNAVENVTFNDKCDVSSGDEFYTLPSSIYLSEVNNPFVFYPSHALSVGNGEIRGISSAAKALSQGQFGQFPLYVFTTEGVWATEVSSTGVYMARQPVTRDVVKSSDSITPIDSAVLFNSDRGIMLLSGSNSECISDVINTETPFDIMSLHGIEDIHTMLGNNAGTCLSIAPFSEFLISCRMLYDYTHQRIIVYSYSYPYAYVFSLKSRRWGMSYCDILYNLNSYPEAMAIDHAGQLINLSSHLANPMTGLLVTRPIKLETNDVLKTMDTVIQRGNFRKGHVKSALYGSRDLYNWFLIWSSKDHYLRGFRGTPYKYFRIACVTELAEDEVISGASLQFTPRHTNRPR